MKKVLAILLALMMVLTLASCSSSGGKDSTGGGNNDNSSIGGNNDNSGKDGENNDNSGKDGGLDIDMSKYPATIEEWTGQNFVDYFTEAGVFKNSDGLETWMQDHEYWTGMPVSECVGCWDDPGMFVVIITILTPDLPDSSQEQYDEWMAGFRENKTCPDEGVYLYPDHMIGNVIFEYETSILDEELYGKMSTAYENLVSALGVTPDF